MEQNVYVGLSTQSNVETCIEGLEQQCIFKSENFEQFHENFIISNKPFIFSMHL